MSKECPHQPNYNQFAHAATGEPDEEFGIVWYDMDKGQSEAYSKAYQDFHANGIVDEMCSWGWCVNEVCKECNMVVGGMGIAACPHDMMHGWRSSYVEGMPKAHPPVKAKGRHRTRIQRSAEVHDNAMRKHLEFQGAFKNGFKEE